MAVSEFLPFLYLGLGAILLTIVVSIGIFIAFLDSLKDKNYIWSILLFIGFFTSAINVFIPVGVLLIYLLFGNKRNNRKKGNKK